MPPRSSSPICERSLDLTLIGIGRRDIPQCSPKHFRMEVFYRTFSDGQRPSQPPFSPPTSAAPSPSDTLDRSTQAALAPIGPPKPHSPQALSRPHPRPRIPALRPAARQPQAAPALQTPSSAGSRFRALLQRSAVEKPAVADELFQQFQRSRENVAAVAKPVLRNPPLERFLALNPGVPGRGGQQFTCLFAQ